MNRRRRFPLAYLVGFIAIGAMAILIAMFLISVQPSTVKVAVPGSDIPAYRLMTKEDFVLQDMLEGDNTPPAQTLTEEKLDQLTKDNKKIFSTVPLLQDQLVDTRTLSDRTLGAFSLVLEDERVVSVGVEAGSAIAAVLQPGMVVNVGTGTSDAESGAPGYSAMAKVIAFGPAQKIAEEYPGVDTGFEEQGDASLVALLAVWEVDAITVAERGEGALVLLTGCRIKENGRIVPSDPERPEACLVPAERLAGREDSASGEVIDDTTVETTTDETIVEEG